MSPLPEATLCSGVADTGAMFSPRPWPTAPSIQNLRGEALSAQTQASPAGGGGRCGHRGSSTFRPERGRPEAQAWALGVRPPVCSEGWGGLGVMELGDGGRGGAGVALTQALTAAVIASFSAGKCM